MLKALSIKARRLSGSSQFVIAFLPRHVRLAVLDKLKAGAVPKRNGEEVVIVARLGLPSSLNAANLLRIDAIWGPAAVLETLVKGELTAGEAEAFVRVVGAYTKVLLAHDFEQRLARLEQDQNESWQFIVFGGLRESTARKLLAE